MTTTKAELAMVEKLSTAFDAFEDTNASKRLAAEEEDKRSASREQGVEMWCTQLERELERLKHGSEVIHLFVIL